MVLVTFGRVVVGRRDRAALCTHRPGGTGQHRLAARGCLSRRC